MINEVRIDNIEILKAFNLDLLDDLTIFLC